MKHYRSSIPRDARERVAATFVSGPQKSLCVAFRGSSFPGISDPMHNPVQYAVPERLLVCQLSVLVEEPDAHSLPTVGCICPVASTAPPDSGRMMEKLCLSSSAKSFGPRSLSTILFEAPAVICGAAALGERLGPDQREGHGFSHFTSLLRIGFPGSQGRSPRGVWGGAPVWGASPTSPFGSPPPPPRVRRPAPIPDAVPSVVLSTPPYSSTGWLPPSPRESPPPRHGSVAGNSPGLERCAPPASVVSVPG